MTLTMETNGTISRWQAADGTDLLFPESNIIVGGKEKLRGGAPVCCPNFGPAPTDELYTGITLPQHGLVRLAGLNAEGKPVPGNPAFHQQEPRVGDDGWTNAGFVFNHPWPHETWVAAQSEVTGEGGQRLQHRITLATESINDCDIPYTIGFHPYFATDGNAFGLFNGTRSWGVYDLVVGESFYVPTDGNPFTLRLADRTIVIELWGGYTGYYVWTDAPDKYICVEPVRIAADGSYHILMAGGVANCYCSITSTPHA